MENRSDWRLSITLPKEQEERIVALRQDPRYTRLSWGEIIRRLIEKGLEDVTTGNNTTTA